MFKNSLKTIGIIVAVAVLAVAIGIGVVALLKSVAPREEGPVVENKKQLNAQEAVGAFGTVGTIQGLSSDYQRQKTESSTGSVIYKKEGKAYSVVTATPHVAIFTAKEANKDDVQLIRDETTVFMSASGYKESVEQQASDGTGPFFMTYESNESVCQLVSSGTAVTKGVKASHLLACATKVAIDDEYAMVEQLTGLYAKKATVPTFAQVTRSEQREGKKALSVLLLSGEKNVRLLFAAIDDKWEYVGNLSSGSKTNAKFTISAELEAAIRNPKYGDFLTRNILGES
jgi:hypothetical protein